MNSFRVAPPPVSGLGMPDESFTVWSDLQDATIKSELDYAG